jgi:hypothetical protein
LPLLESPPACIKIVARDRTGAYAEAVETALSQLAANLGGFRSKVDRLSSVGTLFLAGMFSIPEGRSMKVRDPIDELKDTALYGMLASSDDGYAERITRFVAEIAPILATTEKHFPYYTRHDAHHGYRVVRRIEQVVESSCLEASTTTAFTSVEIFLLIAAAYAHDLGMTVFPGEASSLLKTLDIELSSAWETAPPLQTHLRREHSKRGGEYILRNADTLGVPANLVGALDMMMRAHNLSITELDAMSAPHAAQERQIDIRQLAAIVCVGDAMEFSDTRVMDGVLDRIKLDPSESARVSYRENMKHVCVSDSLAVSDDRRVIVSGTFSEPPVLALAHQTLDQMEEWIQGYCDIDRRSSSPRLKIRPEPFVRNLDFAGGRFERLGVRLNKRSVLDLIVSNAVWRANTGIPIRELLQNAVESCRFRDHHSSPADGYSPAVQVEFDRENRTVSVSDNGCGMSERTVLNNFLTVGSSRSKESGYAQSGYAPIARFGIGFWSVFVIAVNARIETAAFEAHRGSPSTAAAATGLTFEVSIDELMDYTVFAPVVRPCGTKITLDLKHDVAFDEVIMQSRAMLQCSEVPVTLVIDGGVIELPRAQPEVSHSDLLGSRSRLLSELEMKVFRWSGGVGDTDLSLGLAYRLVDGRATFLADPSASLMTALGGIQHPKTSVCGFTVPVLPNPFCLDLLRVGTFRANHRSPRGFEFSLDRQQLQKNEASELFGRDIAALIHQGYREFLAATNSRDAVTISALYDQAAMHGGNVYDVFTGTELAGAAESYPDLLCFRLFPVTQGTELSAVKPIHVDLAEIQRMNGTVSMIQQRVDMKLSGARYLSFDPETGDSLQIAYKAVQTWLAAGTIASPAYVMSANRLGSMLFDSDVESSIRVIGVQPFGAVCVQSVDLGRVRVDSAPQNILAEIHGRWTGAIYLRKFNLPTSKPYVFLGRHRVLVDRASSLASHLQDLVVTGRRMRLAEVVADMKEDDEGFTPQSIKDLVR